MRRGLRRAAFVSVLASTVLLCLAVSDDALGRESFHWHAHWNSNLQSRRFNISHAGIVRIRAKAFDCHGVHIHWSIELRIDKPVAPDESLGSKTFKVCGHGWRTRSYPATDTHVDYFFELHKDLGPWWRAKGVTSFPCHQGYLCDPDD